MRKFTWHHVHQELLSATTFFSPNHFELTTVLYTIEPIIADPSVPSPSNSPQQPPNTPQPDTTVLLEQI